MGKRGRPRNTPVDVVSNWHKQKQKEIEFDRKMDSLTRWLEVKMIEDSLKNPPKIEGDYLHLKGRMGANNYDINIKTMEDQRMAASLLNQFGIYLIRKDH